jgi:hypothetical protein
MLIVPSAQVNKKPHDSENSKAETALPAHALAAFAEHYPRACDIHEGA